MPRSLAHSPAPKDTRDTKDTKKSQSQSQSHHVRRKSGPQEKKRPTLSRRTTPQFVKTVGRRDRERERERDDDVKDRGERDGGESFPQFCMTCEKQFLPANSTILYCSESCRLHDQTPSAQSSPFAFPPLSPPSSPYHDHAPTSGPDIIPRFSPTLPRPRSYFNLDPPSTSPTALSSLRDLAASLPDNPPSPTSILLSYMPFTSPKPTSYGSSPRADDHFASSWRRMGGGMDRPLPPRSGPGGYGNRGRVDLVTPIAVGL